ncbi:MAG: hypothetical protein WCJ81_09550 [bacterium]
MTSQSVETLTQEMLFFPTIISHTLKENPLKSQATVTTYKSHFAISVGKTPLE